MPIQMLRPGSEARSDSTSAGILFIPAPPSIPAASPSVRGPKSKTSPVGDVATLIQPAPEEKVPEMDVQAYDGLGGIQLHENWLWLGKRSTSLNITSATQPGTSKGLGGESD